MSNSCRVCPPERHRKFHQCHDKIGELPQCCLQQQIHLATLSQGIVLWAERRLRKTNQGVRRRKGQFLLNWTQRLRSLCHEYPSADKSGEKSRNRLLKSFHMQRRHITIIFPARTQNVLIAFPPFPPWLQPLKSSQRVAHWEVFPLGCYMFSLLLFPHLFHR